MIVVESFLICDGCGINYGVDVRHRSGTSHRAHARLDGWKLISGDGFKYGDYCPECLKEKKHKKTKQSDMKITRLLIGDIYIEKDINNEPRIVMKDELGDEWVLEQDGGQWMKLTKKEKSWYFDEKNRNKPTTNF